MTQPKMFYCCTQVALAQNERGPTVCPKCGTVFNEKAERTLFKVPVKKQTPPVSEESAVVTDGDRYEEGVWEPNGTVK